MPDRKFLQEFPLYRKFKLAFFIPNRLDEIDKPPIKMFCDNCKTDQTFAMTNEYFNEYFSRGYSNIPSHGKIVRAEYTCLHCKEFNRTFFIQIDKNLNWIMKVGQFPAWTIAGNPQIETLLGQHKEYLKRGLICESQGFGIGAFAYYRRIVEEVIDKLLDLIPRLLSGSELAQFKDALDKTKTTHVTSEKIELVKDLLPQILRPNNTNPLKLLHEALSEGLHAQSEEECLESAGAVRETLVFLANQIAASSEASDTYLESVQVLLERKQKRVVEPKKASE